MEHGGWRGVVAGTRAIVETYLFREQTANNGIELSSANLAAAAEYISWWRTRAPQNNSFYEFQIPPSLV